MKILVVEDALKLAQFLSRVLSEEGYAVDLCADGEQAVVQAQAGHYDIILLDWMLPGLDGLTVCRQLRRAGLATPIIMLTARGETSEKVLGLDAGADDFVAKPFEVEELVARVRAQLRRSEAFAELCFGPIRIHRINREVLVGNEAVTLTEREYNLLTYLIQHSHRVVKRSELLAHVWQTQLDPGTNVVDVQMSRLRDKLGKHAEVIETVRGVGYRLSLEPVG